MKRRRKDTAGSLDLIHGLAGELNGAKSSGRAIVGSQEPAGVSRCISCMCRNLSGKRWAWSPSELRKSAVAFSYYRRLLARSTVEQGARAADNGTIRKSGAIRFAPIFVFIDRVPIALERALR